MSIQHDVFKLKKKKKSAIWKHFRNFDDFHFLHFLEVKFLVSYIFRWWKYSEICFPILLGFLGSLLLYFFLIHGERLPWWGILGSFSAQARGFFQTVLRSSPPWPNQPWLQWSLAHALTVSIEGRLAATSLHSFYFQNLMKKWCCHLDILGYSLFAVGQQKLYRSVIYYEIYLNLFVPLRVRVCNSTEVEKRVVTEWATQSWGIYWLQALQEHIGSKLDSDNTFYHTLWGALPFTQRHCRNWTVSKARKLKLEDIFKSNLSAQVIPKTQWHLKGFLPKLSS